MSVWTARALSAGAVVTTRPRTALEPPGGLTFGPEIVYTCAVQPDRTAPAAGYDVVIVGGGVVGCAIAWRLSFTTASVALLEAGHDVGDGASKGNTGIATCGADCAPGTLEAELVTRSSGRWGSLCAALDTPWRRMGTLAVAVTEQQAAGLEHLRDQAARNGCRAELVSGEAVRALEPLVTTDARAALHIPDDGIIDSLRLTIGYAELAARNGVDVLTTTRVTGVESADGRVAAVRTTRGRIGAGYLVNAAGVEAGRISALASGDEFSMWPRQGQYWLLDRELGGRFQKIVGGVPTEHTRGIYCVPTTNGSLLLGPTALDMAYPGSRSVDAPTLEAVFDAAHRLVPAVRRDLAIKTFAANRPASDPVYRLGPDGRVPNLVHAAAIRSTGVSSSPATAERVHQLLAEAGAPVMDDDPSAAAALEPLQRLLGHPDPERLLAVDPRYGQVVCACEQVTAAEIAAACAMRVPPRSLDALRKRTRATGGRCQGTVCLAGVSFLFSVHMGVHPWEIPVGEPEATLGVPS
jgi:glycerol-3-phosphate dehydrogenase